MWLEADITIRQLSHGRRSLDDVARAFFGRTDSGPQVLTYTRDDVIAALNSVQPFDWRVFLGRRIDAIALHPPDPFTPAGWRVVYAPVPSAFDRLTAGRRKLLDARYSLGLVAHTDGTILDVLNGSPAARAGLGPGVKIVAIDDRAFAAEPQVQLDAALQTAQRTGSVQLLVLGGNVYRDVALPYRGGPRFPHLERVAGAADLLSPIAAPKRSH
jgi:predicted metalloprotease with PDZ domain